MVPFSSWIPEHDRRVYRIDALAASYYGWFIGLLLPFVPVMLKRLAATPIEMGLVTAAGFVSFLVAFPLLPKLNRFRALDLVTVPSFFSRLAVISLGFLDEPAPILTVFLLGQIVEGVGLAPYTQVLAVIYSNEGRSVAMGCVRTCLATNQIVATFLGGLLLDRGKGTLVFALAGLCGAVSSWMFRRVLPRQASPRLVAPSMGWREIRQVFAMSPQFAWMNLTIVIFGFGNLLVFGVMPTLLVTRFAVSNTALGLLNVLANVTLAAGFAFLGRRIRQTGPQRGMLLALVAGLSLPWLYLVAPGSVWLAVPFVITGILNASFELSWSQLIIAYAPPGLVASFTAVFTLLLGLRGCVATIAANLALPYVAGEWFLLIAGMFTVAGFAIGWLGRDRWRVPEPAAAVPPRQIGPGPVAIVTAVEPPREPDPGERMSAGRLALGSPPLGDAPRSAA